MGINDELAKALGDALASKVDADIICGTSYLTDKCFKAWVDSFVERELINRKPKWMPEGIWLWLHKERIS